MTIKKILAVILSFSVIAGAVLIPVFAADDEEIVYLDYQFEENAAEEFAQIKKNVESRTPSLAGSLKDLSIEDGMLVMRSGSATGSYATLPKVFNPDGNTRDAVLEYKVKMDFSTKYCYLGYDKLRYTGDSNMIHTTNAGIAWSQVEANSKTYIAVDKDYGGHDEWHTYAFIYDKDERTRRLFIDGVEYSNGKEFEEAGDNGWFESNTLRFTFKLYTATSTTDNASFEYMKVYTPAENPGFRAYTGGYERNKIYVDFNTTVIFINPEMITVGDISATDVRLVDVENQIYEVTLESPLELKKEYEVSVIGAGDSIGRTIDSTSTFTTREEAFYINNIRVENEYGKLEAIASGDATLYADAVNEFENPESFTFYALQYDENGYMNKDNVFAGDYTAEELPVSVDEALSVASDSSRLSAFAFKSAEIPIPVSGAVNYNAEGAEEVLLTYNISAYDSEPEAELVINDDYSGATVTVDINDEEDRAVGLVAKYKDDTEYIAYGKTENGIVSFNVPLREEMVGEYSFSFGVEGGSEAIDGGVIDYYSPAYTERMIAENINSENASEETVSEFVSVLGEYLKLEVEGLEKVEDDSYVFRKLLDIRDTKEGKEFATQQEFSDAFSLAVKLAQIYEGNGTEDILKNGTEIEVDEQTVNTFNKLISASARAYVSEKLKGTDYPDLITLAESVKKYTVIGGLYKASHYSLADTFIGIYGEEAGINVSAYKSLRYPEKVAKKVIGTEYGSIAEFGDAVKTAVTAQARAEASQSSGSSGGGGGGGSRISGTTYTPDKKEEVKEETKEEKPVKSYSDVTANDWFYNDVMWATGEGMFIGTSETTFTPSMNLTWEQIAIVLKRIGHTLDNKNGSADISRGDFAEVLYNFLADKTQYKTRDEWISGTKIFIGDQNGDMMFEKTLTRAECCTVLRRIESK